MEEFGLPSTSYTFYELQEGKQASLVEGLNECSGLYEAPGQRSSTWSIDRSVVRTTPIEWRTFMYVDPRPPTSFYPSLLL